MHSLTPDLRRAFATLERRDVHRMLYSELITLALWSLWVGVFKPFHISSAYDVLERVPASEHGVALLIITLTLGAVYAIRRTRHGWVCGALVATGWGLIFGSFASAEPTSTGTLIYGVHTFITVWLTYRAAKLPEEGR